MALKRLLTRIKFIINKSDSAPVATDATLPLDITLRLNLVLSPTVDGRPPHLSIRHGQAFATLDTPLTTSVQGLMTSSSRDQLQTHAPPPTAPVTPTRPPLPQSVVATPCTMQTLESKTLDTPEHARPVVHIVGSSVKLPIGVPSVIPDGLPSQKGLQQSPRYKSPCLEPQPDEPASRLDNRPSLASNLPANKGLQPRQDPQHPQRPPGLKFSVLHQNNRENGPPPRPPRGETLAFISNMSPTFEHSPFNLPIQNCPSRLDVIQARNIDINPGTVTVQRISNNGNITYSIEAGGHRYMATGQVGSGAFGYVWYAIRDGKDEVAIKVINKAGLLAQYVFCADDGRPTTQQLFEGSRSAAEAVNAEYEAFKRITEERSPFLTPLLHAFKDRDNFYFVMRFYPQTLRTRARFGFMHWQLRLVAAELLVALQHLHNLRIVHLDLKMENVLITPSGHVCIADFGNAHVMDREMNYQRFHAYRMYGISGTEGYLPPERVERHRGYNFKTDTWTYAVILLELFLMNGGHWYSIYYNEDGTHKFGNNYKIPASYNENHRMFFITPREEEINLVHDADAKDLLLSILSPQYYTMRPEWEAIRCHPFFASIDWKKLENRGYDPMFKACLGNTPLQPVDSGKLAIKRLHPQLKKVVLEQEKRHVALGRVQVDYRLPPDLAHDALHGATCKATVLPGRVCNCDLPANWHKI